MFSNFNEFINSVKETVTSTICLNNTRLLPRTEFEEHLTSLSNLNQRINRNIDNSDDETMEETSTSNSEEENIQTNINQQMHIFNGNSAIIYVRASTKEQNIDAQKHSCEQFCHKHNLVIKKIYIEKCSAYKQYSQIELPKLINNNKNTNLIVFSVDRFSRNVKKSDATIKLLESKNIVLISLKENINLNTAFGKHTFRNYVNAAQYESELISERVKNSIRYRKANNIHIGQVPYGYKLENKKIVKNDQEQTVIAFILRNYNTYKTSSNITIELYKILKKYNRPNSDYVSVLFTDENDKYEYYSYKNNEKIKITSTIISEILNDYNIKKRNKKWTPGSVTYTLRNINTTMLKHLDIN